MPELSLAEPAKAAPQQVPAAAPQQAGGSAAQAAPPAAEPPAIANTSAAALQPGSLSHFFESLRQLSSGTRQGHVRVLWLGDSHTAADYLTGSVRALLQARFGDGGPGFVRIGTKAYRHDGLKIVRDGKWNVDPDPPARRSRQDDGIFGLAGTRAVPAAGARFSVESSPRVMQGDEIGSFELSYALPHGSSFDVELGGKRSTVTAQSSSDSLAGITHLSLAAPLRSQLVLTPRSGAPRLFALMLERKGRSGVVLDAAGIDGARLETPLAWDERAFVAEVARRAPQLFVVAYGTNEAFDALKVEKYGAQLGRLVARLRQGAPQASCLVLGPTDAALGEGSVPRIFEVTRALAEAATSLHCSFLSLQALMGGEGSFARGMKAKERLAQPDRLHLTPKGYQDLGAALGKRMLDAYSAGRADLP